MADPALDIQARRSPDHAPASDADLNGGARLPSTTSRADLQAEAAQTGSAPTTPPPETAESRPVPEGTTGGGPILGVDFGKEWEKIRENWPNADENLVKVLQRLPGKFGEEFKELASDIARDPGKWAVVLGVIAVGTAIPPVGGLVFGLAGLAGKGVFVTNLGKAAHGILTAKNDAQLDQASEDLAEGLTALTPSAALGVAGKVSNVATKIPGVASVFKVSQSANVVGKAMRYSGNLTKNTVKVVPRVALVQDFVKEEVQDGGIPPLKQAAEMITGPLPPSDRGAEPSSAEQQSDLPVPKGKDAASLLAARPESELQARVGDAGSYLGNVENPDPEGNKWLKEALNVWLAKNGRESELIRSVDSGVMDKHTWNVLRDFQRQHSFTFYDVGSQQEKSARLEADGIAGVRTLQALEKEIGGTAISAKEMNEAIEREKATIGALKRVGPPTDEPSADAVEPTPESVEPTTDEVQEAEAEKLSNERPAQGVVSPAEQHAETTELAADLSNRPELAAEVVLGDAITPAVVRFRTEEGDKPKLSEVMDVAEQYGFELNPSGISNEFFLLRTPAGVKPRQRW